jgi:hypothetical protein
MDRIKLQQLAELRLKDAEVLIAAGQWDAAYYLLGYCVECALKACIAQQFRQHEVPDKRLVNAFYTHRLDELLAISGVKGQFDSLAGSDAAIKRNWDTILEWNEAVRYDIDVTEAEARGLLGAVANATSGIMPWLKKYW